MLTLLYGISGAMNPTQFDSDETLTGSMFENESYFNTFPYKQYIQEDNAIDKVSKGKRLLLFFFLP
jgi:hypothetical protein